MAQSQPWQWIPTHLTLEQFELFGVEPRYGQKSARWVEKLYLESASENPRQKVSGLRTSVQRAGVQDDETALLV